MAGRRWAQGPASGTQEEKQRPRPSERGTKVSAAGAKALPGTKAAAAGTKGGAAAGKPSSTKAPLASATPRKKAPPSPEAMERARALLNPPKAPWYPLPLAEAAIVIGMVAMLAAVALKNALGASAGFTLIIIGTAEFSWREHRHGYRSHASILGAIIALTVGIVAWRLIGLTRPVCIGIAVVVFLMALGMLDRTYVPARQREPAPPSDD